MIQASATAGGIDVADSAASSRISGHSHASLRPADVLATLSDGIVVLSPSWKFVYVNEVAERILSQRADQLLGQDHWELFPAVSGTELETMYRKAAATGVPCDMDFLAQAVGRWFRIKAHPSSLGLTISFSDIHDQKVAATAQMVAEERFRLAASNRCITLYEQDHELRYTWLYPLHPEHRHALGKTDAEAGTGNAMRELVALKQQVLATGQEARKEVAVNLSIGTRHYDLFVSPRRDALGKIIGVAGAALDITDRKEFEQALRQSEERLRTTYDHAPIGIAELDLEGRFVSMNRLFTDQIGYQRDELLHKSFTEITSPEDIEPSSKDFAQLVAGKIDHYSREKRYRHKDGHDVWASLTVTLIKDAEGSPRFVLKLSQDISQEKRAAKSQQLLYRLVGTVNRAAAPQEIFDAALDALCQSQGCPRAAILLTDSADLMRFAAWRGLSESYRAAVEGHSPWGKNDPEPQPVCIGNVSEASFSADLKRTVTHEGIHAMAFIPLTYEKRLLGKFMVYFDQPHEFDPADIRIAETIARQVGFAIERQRAASALEALVAARTASLQEAIHQMEEFSYTVSHDLRAPVRAMNSYVEAIVEDYGASLPSEVLGYLERIARNGKRMDALVRDTLAYSRAARRELTMAPVSLDRMVKDVVDSLESANDKNSITVVGPLGEAIAHEVSLSQAIGNLLRNALKFVRPGIRPRVTVWTERSHARLRLKIEDNGIGIAPQHQHRLFRIFERLHPDQGFEGTGIGLAIVRKSVERMGGSVGVASDGISGSTFWIELPTAFQRSATR